MPRRSGGEVWPGLWRGQAAGPRRRRAMARRCSARLRSGICGGGAWDRVVAGGPGGLKKAPVILGGRARRGRRGDCGRALLCGESGSRNRISVIRLGVKFLEGPRRLASGPRPQGWSTCRGRVSGIERSEQRCGRGSREEEGR